MMEFVLLVLAFACGSLLSSVVALAVMFNTKVMTWYMKKVTKMTEEVVEEMCK